MGIDLHAQILYSCMYMSRRCVRYSFLYAARALPLVRSSVLCPRCERTTEENPRGKVLTLNQHSPSPSLNAAPQWPSQDGCAKSQR